jgi:hypothetical protein
LSDNLDNLLGDIYSSSSQSQGVKELANLINNLSQLLLKAISQLEGRVMKLEQQVRSGGGTPRPPQPSAPATTRAPMPKAASPFSTPTTPPPPPPKPAAKPAAPVAASPAAPASPGGGPASAAEAASMLGVTLKKAPAKTPAAASTTDSGPSFLTGTVNPDAPAATSPGATDQPDAMAPTSTGGGVAGPGGGFRGELAEKLAKRRQKVTQQIEEDFEGADLVAEPGEEEVVEESTSSELKLDLEDELRSAFSKLKG